MSYDEHLISVAGGDGDDTVEQWQFLNANGGWVDANPNFPRQSAADNARYFGTYRTRSRRVTTTAWRES